MLEITISPFSRLIGRAIKKYYLIFVCVMSQYLGVFVGHFMVTHSFLIYRLPLSIALRDSFPKIFCPHIQIYTSLAPPLPFSPIVAPKIIYYVTLLPIVSIFIILISQIYAWSITLPIITLTIIFRF
ncbi:unnamed protein product [Meloidogyne enterolobii]|uniref:Uncharacterized protein n=1 Tax=Meloidogyne enterolobii TaxID=390850 RepID=A0ACB0Z573_MELEN